MAKHKNSFNHSQEITISTRWIVRHSLRIGPEPNKPKSLHYIKFFLPIKVKKLQIFVVTKVKTPNRLPIKVKAFLFILTFFLSLQAVAAQMILFQVRGWAVLSRKLPPSLNPVASRCQIP